MVMIHPLFSLLVQQKQKKKTRLMIVMGPLDKMAGLGKLTDNSDYANAAGVSRILFPPSLLSQPLSICDAQA